MAPEDEVRKASAEFYAALNRMIQGDAGSLSDIWSHESTVTTMHPIGGRQIGWKDVRASWEQTAQAASNGKVTLHEQIIQASGDMAYELGVEHGEAVLAGKNVAIDQRVTNVYRREPGGWKIVHHHTDLSPLMQEVVAKR